MNNNIQEFYFFDRNKLYEKLTSVILLNIKNSKKYIALAGGNTPQEFYIYLSNFIKKVFGNFSTIHSSFNFLALYHFSKVILDFISGKNNQKNYRG